MPQLICLSQCLKHSAPRGSRVFVSKEELLRENLSLLQMPGILECVMLSTCIRFEIYAVAADETDPLKPLTEYLLDAHGVTPNGAATPFAAIRGEDAARHLFCVACGLDSRILGEKQIVGQVKHAYRTALDAGCTGPVLNTLFQKCLGLSKKVRTRTGIDKGASSAASLAVKLLLREFGDLGSARALIVGAGQMGTLMGLHLASKGCADIRFAARSPASARPAAEQCDAGIIPFSRFREALPECDILVAATGAPHEIVSRGDIARAMETRGGRALCIIDLADPPNVDPSVSSFENVALFTIRCIHDLANETRESRAAAACEARTMIEEEVRALCLRRVKTARTAECGVPASV